VVETLKPVMNSRRVAAGMLRSRHEQSDEHLAPEEVEDVDGNVMLQSVTADWIATAIAASISLSRLPW
jgi:hypothetical protein